MRVERLEGMVVGCQVGWGTVEEEEVLYNIIQDLTNQVTIKNDHPHTPVYKNCLCTSNEE